MPCGADLQVLSNIQVLRFLHSTLLVFELLPQVKTAHKLRRDEAHRKFNAAAPTKTSLHHRACHRLEWLIHITHSKSQVQAQSLLCRHRKHTVASEQCALTCSVCAYLTILEIWAESCVNFILAVDLGIKLLVNISSQLLLFEKVKRPKTLADCSLQR